jgi:hypothetical protein
VTPGTGEYDVPVTVQRVMSLLSGQQRGKDSETMRRKPLIGIAAAVLAVTAFAGCSDDDDDDTPPDTGGGDVTTPLGTTGDTETVDTETVTTTS